MIVLQMITTTFVIAGVELVEAAVKTADDDQLIDAGNQLAKFPTGLVIFFSLLQIVLYALGVQGAIVYKKWMVYCALSSYGLNFILNIIGFNIFGLVISATLAYPHVFFIREMDQNIMSKFRFTTSDYVSNWR